MDNIRYGRPDATDEECIEEARLANADGFIRRLPRGYRTVISGGSSNLSQGQAQYGFWSDLVGGAPARQT